ncbi:unnamed protein product, partial [Rotaria sp. Silwood2]
ISTTLTSQHRILQATGALSGSHAAFIADGKIPSKTFICI